MINDKPGRKAKQDTHQSKNSMTPSRTYFYTPV